jgi:HME family heavy-metal exporter
MEGKLFVPLGIAFIVSTLASLVVSVTVTPVLSFYLLPRMKNLDHGDTKVLAWLKARYRSSLQGVLDTAQGAMAAAGAAVLVAAAAVPFFPTTFLPPFNEGTLLIGLRLNPGVTLAESVGAGAPGGSAHQAGARSDARRKAQRAGRVGRARRGRARQRARRGPEARGRADAQHGRDQRRHPQAPGEPAGRHRDRPAHLAPHRPHAVGRALADRDQDLRRGSRRAAGPGRCAAREAGHHPGHRRPADREAGAGAADQGAHRLRGRRPVRRAGAAGAGRAAAALVEGEKVTQIVEGGRRFALVVRLPESARSVEGLARS